jgi:hypothetical protein
MCFEHSGKTRQWLAGPGTSYFLSGKFLSQKCERSVDLPDGLQKLVQFGVSAIPYWGGDLSPFYDFQKLANYFNSIR